MASHTLTFSDVIGLDDSSVLPSKHKEMSTVNLVDQFTLSDVLAKDTSASTSRHEMNFVDGLAIGEIKDIWRGDHYYRSTIDYLRLVDVLSLYATTRFYDVPHDRLKLSDYFHMKSSDRFQEDPNDTLSLSDHFNMSKCRQSTINFSDLLPLSEQIITQFKLNVIGGTGDGNYQHGQRVPVEVTLVDYEQFVVWGGDNQYVENIFAKSTYVQMPNISITIEAIKSNVSERDVLALGGQVSAGKLDIILEQGSAFERNLYYKDTDGNPIPISGWTAAMQIREYKAATTPLLSLTSSAGDIIVDGPNGHIEVHIPANITGALDFDWGYYDIELSPNGVAAETFRLLEGRVKLSKEVTR